MPICPNCGAEFIEGDDSCPNCGAFIEETESIEEPLPESMPETLPVFQPEAEENIKTSIFDEDTGADYRVALLKCGNCSVSNAAELIADILGYGEAAARNIIRNYPCDVAQNLTLKQAAYLAQAFTEYGMTVTVYGENCHEKLGDEVNFSIFDTFGYFTDNSAAVFAGFTENNRIVKVVRWKQSIEKYEEFLPMLKRSTRPTHRHRDPKDPHPVQQPKASYSSSRKEAPAEGDKPRTYGDKPRTYGDKPRIYGDKPRTYGDKPRTYGDKPRTYGDKPRTYGDKPRTYGDKPRTYGDKPRTYGDRKPSENGGEKHYDKPRTYGDKPRENGAEKHYDKPRTYGDKPRENGAEKHYDKPRTYGDKPRTYGDKPRTYGDKPRTYGDKPRTYGDKPRTYGDRKPDESGGEKRYDKPRTYGDKPRTYGDKPRTYGDKPRTYGDKPRTYGDKPRTYGDKPRTYGDKKPGGFGGKKYDNKGGGRGFNGGKR